MSESAICSNCRRVIPSTETAYLTDDEAVLCAGCHAERVIVKPSGWFSRRWKAAAVLSLVLLMACATVAMIWVAGNSNQQQINATASTPVQIETHAQRIFKIARAMVRDGYVYSGSKKRTAVTNLGFAAGAVHVSPPEASLYKIEWQLNALPPINDSLDIYHSFLSVSSDHRSIHLKMLDAVSNEWMKHTSAGLAKDIATDAITLLTHAVLVYGNDVGIAGEPYDVDSQEAAGNFTIVNRQTASNINYFLRVGKRSGNYMLYVSIYDGGYTSPPSLPWSKVIIQFNPIPDPASFTEQNRAKRLNKE